MGFLPPRNICLLFLIISASIISSSNAGRRSKLLDKSLAEEFAGAYEEAPLEGKDKEESMMTVHERMLWHDYGRYNPSPSFRRPRHKLIPN